MDQALALFACLPLAGCAGLIGSEPPTRQVFVSPSIERHIAADTVAMLLQSWSPARTGLQRRGPSEPAKGSTASFEEELARQLRQQGFAVRDATGPIDEHPAPILWRYVAAALLAMPGRTEQPCVVVWVDETRWARCFSTRQGAIQPIGPWTRGRPTAPTP